MSIMDRVLLWLRFQVVGRKWVLWVALLLVLAVVFEIGVALLPHHVLNTLLQYEEKANGIREYPNGVRE